MKKAEEWSKKKEINMIVRETISLSWLCKNRSKKQDSTGGTGSDWQNDWSLEVLGQCFTK